MVEARRWLVPLSVAALLLLSAGCMYRGETERRQANPTFVREELDRVSAAVERYYEQRKVYPIKNSDESTPVYEKYVIDLNRLVQSDMLSSVPTNAFENGGAYYYLLLHPEEEPLVRLLDLVTVQRLAELQKMVDDFSRQHGGALPLGTEVSRGFFAVDFDKLEEPKLQVQSLYSGQFLPLLLHESGDIAVDYSLDIMEALRKSEASGALSEDDPLRLDDPRKLLVAVSPYAPIRSYPYRWHNGEPVLAAPE